MTTTVLYQSRRIITLRSALLDRYTPIDIDRFMPMNTDRSKTTPFGQQPHTREAEKDGGNGGEG